MLQPTKRQDNSLHFRRGGLSEWNYCENKGSFTVIEEAAHQQI